MEGRANPLQILAAKDTYTLIEMISTNNVLMIASLATLDHNYNLSKITNLKNILTI